MAQVDLTFCYVRGEEDDIRVSDACFNATGKVIYSKSPDEMVAKDVSVLLHFAGEHSRTPYWAEIKVDLASDDWPTYSGPGTNAEVFSENQKVYDKLAKEILDEIAPTIPAGQEFFVWVRGRITGFAEGVGDFHGD